MIPTSTEDISGKFVLYRTECIIRAYRIEKVVDDATGIAINDFSLIVFVTEEGIFGVKDE